MPIAPLLSLALLQGSTPAERPFALMVGDPAPPMQVAEWVQGEPVERFEPGQVYVVEFWATWCVPCKVAIPHLNELSKAYAGKVRVVGVSVWERISEDKPYAVPKFVAEMGEQMTYTVAADVVKPGQGEGPMSRSWMTAAGQNGIPTSFIVDGAGRIAWIGSPMRIDQPLSDVVAGKWDLEAAAKKYAQDLRLKGVITALNRDVTRAKKERDFAAAVRAIDAELSKEPALESYFGLDKYFLLLEAQRPAEAAAYGQRLVAQVFAQNANALNQLAWTIVDPQRKGGGDYALALQAAERAVALDGGKDPNSLDTLGLALFKTGQTERAIEIQARAVELAAGMDSQHELRARLAEFKAGRGKR